ncbi:MAG: DNA alkylation repair protein [Reichenbachiella sp.]|uniref:DNA alkylation repair protein n=1 Tax=Reichenbachiella sp. TaxID=2184521 RepID=UPI003263AA03
MIKYHDAPSVLTVLRELADPEIVTFKDEKYAIRVDNSLGIYIKDLKALAKEIKKDDKLALELFGSGVYEAQILCSKLFNPKSITPELIERWVSAFNSWELCDSFCMSFIGQSLNGYDKIFEYVLCEEEFQKRAGFVLMVGHHFGQKKAPNEDFIRMFPLLIEGAIDDRNFVKKAVNWALRTIGKRNKDLNKLALATAEEILRIDSATARWIAKDAIRKLSSPTVSIQDYPRDQYRPI